MGRIDFDISEELLAWYDENRRVLPWREDPTPYHVWLSEIMLQQTRVEAVKRYYERFLAAFPDVESLANADIDVVLKLWEGLGYYSRARNLQKAAHIIVNDYGGRFPAAKKELLQLPGIGEYTSSAILAIAFQKRHIAIDGNLIRVYARLVEDPNDSKSEKIKDNALVFWSENLKERPGDFNQALMDLGELVCLPNGAPKCFECPFYAICKAHAHGRETQFPILPERKKKRLEKKTVFVLRCQDKIVLRKRPDSGLLASLYEFPNVEGHFSLEEATSFLEKKGYVVSSFVGEKTGKHVFTHLVWDMVCYAFEVDSIPSLEEDFVVCAKEEAISRYSVPSAFKSFMTFI